MKRWALFVVLAACILMPAQQHTVAPNSTSDAATSATGSAVPAKGAYLAGNGSGNLTGLTLCDSSAFVNFTTATTTQIVALVSGKLIHVCSYQISFVGSATANSFIFKSGTGTNCATGTASISLTMWGPNATGSGRDITRGNGVGQLFSAGSGNALCGTTSAATTVGVWVTYTQF